jgi:hypothetical protein
MTAAMADRSNVRLAERLGMSDEERAVVYYASLLINIGCHADAHEQAKWYGGGSARGTNRWTGSGSRAGLRRMGAP